MPEEPKKIYIKADLPNLLKMTSDEIGNPGVTIGFGVAIDYLNIITDRALETNDELTLACLYQIGFIEPLNEGAKAQYEKTIEEYKASKS